MDLPKKARTWRREFLGSAALEGASRLAGWGLAALAALLWTDRAFSLPQGVREALWLLGGAAALAAAYALLLRPWLGFDWGMIFEAAAREFPELKEYLRPAWEFLRGSPDPRTSEELKAAHLERTDRLLQSLAERKVFPWRPGRSARRGALAALLAGVSLPWLGAGPSWERVLAPWREVPLESFVKVSPGDAAVDWGASAVLTARWEPGSAAARDNEDLQLWVREASGWKKSPWDRLGGREASFTIAELTAPLQYRVRWRDLSSRSYRLTPVPVPQLESLRARVFGRGRSALAALQSAEPLSVLRGSWVAITGRPNQALAKAAMRLSSSPVPIPMRLVPSGDYEGSFQVLEDAALHFELETPDGREDGHPVVYPIKALADQPPKIELLSPLVPLEASPADTIPIAYSANDDGGLARISLVLREPGKAEKEIPLEKLPKQPLDFVGDYPLELSAFGPGKLEFHLKVLDNAQPPQSGLSEKGVIEVVDFESAHAAAAARWLSAEKDLDELSARQEKVRGRLAAGAEAALSPQEAAELEADSAGLPESWERAAESASELAGAMEADAYANPGLSAQARSLSEQLDRARRQDLPAALQAAQDGQWGQARKRHERLSELARKGRRFLSEGKRLQGLEDFFTQAGRMSETGSELRSGLESLAGRAGGPSTEELRKLNESLAKLQKQMDSFEKALGALPKAAPQSAEDGSRRAYSMPLEAARDSARALQEALASGDYAAAARLAGELEEELSQIQKALSAAALDAAKSPGGRASQRLQKAQAMWSELIDEQAGVIEETQRLDDARLERLLKAQKDLLSELARRQGALISSAAAQGLAISAPVASRMKAVQAEFEERAAGRAREALAEISAALRAAGALDQRRESYEWFAAAEDDIRRRLEEGPPPPENVVDAGSSAAARRQGEVRGKTGELGKEVESAAEDSGADLGDALDTLDKAQLEQSAAEGALNRGDSAEGLRREQGALDLLEQGNEQASRQSRGQGAVESAMTEPFSRPRIGVRGARGGESGSDLGPVPLPRAADFRPPKEIREELEKSLKEKRPEAYDALIKEYFKRIAQ